MDSSVAADLLVQLFDFEMGSDFTQRCQKRELLSTLVLSRGTTGSLYCCREGSLGLDRSQAEPEALLFCQPLWRASFVILAFKKKRLKDLQDVCGIWSVFFL
uniref:Uncharacterized protein n=1 Tax=Micrurus corallinus TaxID=54390 RepID=A0A2D4FQP1_MICCO